MNGLMETQYCVSSSNGRRAYRLNGLQYHVQRRDGRGISDERETSRFNLSSPTTVDNSLLSNTLFKRIQ